MPSYVTLLVPFVDRISSSKSCYHQNFVVQNFTLSLNAISSRIGRWSLLYKGASQISKNEIKCLNWTSCSVMYCKIKKNNKLLGAIILSNHPQSMLLLLKPQHIFFTMCGCVELYDELPLSFLINRILAWIVIQLPHFYRWPSICWGFLYQLSVVNSVILTTVINQFINTDGECIKFSSVGFPASSSPLIFLTFARSTTNNSFNLAPKNNSH
jgi:hypothetical protein